MKLRSETMAVHIQQPLLNLAATRQNVFNEHAAVLRAWHDTVAETSR